MLCSQKHKFVIIQRHISECRTPRRYSVIYTARYADNSLMTGLVAPVPPWLAPALFAARAIHIDAPRLSFTVSLLLLLFPYNRHSRFLYFSVLVREWVWKHKNKTLLAYFSTRQYYEQFCNMFIVIQVRNIGFYKLKWLYNFIRLGYG